MNDVFYDPIVAEVRQNREKLLADFGGDMKKYQDNIAEQRSTWEAAGFHYETEEERQSRIAWREKQEEELARKVANL